MAGLLIWGAGLTHRVASLEEDLKVLKQLPIDVAKLQVGVTGLLEQMKDLNSAIRWMREPADTGAKAPK
jgi:hypothetical protein